MHHDRAVTRFKRDLRDVFDEGDTVTDIGVSQAVAPPRDARPFGGSLIPNG